MSNVERKNNDHVHFCHLSIIDENHVLYVAKKGGQTNPTTDNRQFRLSIVVCWIHLAGALD